MLILSSKIKQFELQMKEKNIQPSPFIIPRDFKKPHKKKSETVKLDTFDCQLLIPTVKPFLEGLEHL